MKSKNMDKIQNRSLSDKLLSVVGNNRETTRYISIRKKNSDKQ
jgi:hypothetical protein